MTTARGKPKKPSGTVVPKLASGGSVFGLFKNYHCMLDRVSFIKLSDMQTIFQGVIQKVRNVMAGRWACTISVTNSYGNTRVWGANYLHCVANLVQ